MTELTARAEELISHVLKMREHAEAIKAYCTHDCHNCPIGEWCDWDGNVDYIDSNLESIEVMADFINKADKKDAEESDRQFKEATGYDPWEWDAERNRYEP